MFVLTTYSKVLQLGSLSHLWKQTTSQVPWCY